MNTKKPRIVILGAGFGGLTAARKLKKSAAEIILVDRNNYHLFQPLLYQVAAAYLDPEQIAKPIRGIIRHQKNLTFRMEEVTAVDPKKKQFKTQSATIDYDYCILSAGGRTNFFNMENLEKQGFSLKSLEDAVSIRNHVLNCFERAAVVQDDEKKKALLTIVIGGGGPAGVEMAGAFAELVRQVLVRDFREFNKEDYRIILCEGADRILPDLPSDLAETAIRILRKKGVDVRLNALISDFDGRKVRLKGGEYISARTLIWTAGIAAEEVMATSGGRSMQNSRIEVNSLLQIPGFPEAYVIGDAAYWEENGRPIPMVAPAAVQMGEHAAENIIRQVKGKKPVSFHYNNPGALATIGRNAAVAYIKGMKLKGFFAWMVWVAVHILRLIGFRNRIIVLINWAWDYFFLERASRLIIKMEKK